MEALMRSLKNVKLNLSFSRGNTYSHCQRRYYIEYVMGLRGPSSDACENGTATHELLSDDELEIEDGEYSEDVIEWVRRGDAFLHGLSVAGATVEKEKEFHIPLTRDIMLNGSIDVVIHQGSRISVVDYKTNRKMYEPDDTLQLKTYAAALFKKYPGVQFITATLFFLRFNRHVSVMYRRKVQSEIFKYYKGLGQEIIEKIPKGYSQFTPNENYCDSCAGAIMCHLTDPRNDEDFDQLAGWALRGNAAIGQAKDLLKPYIEEHGPLVVGEKEWRFNPISPTKVFDMVLLKEKLEDEGIDPLNILSVDSKAIKKIPEELYSGTYTEKENKPRFGLFNKIVP